MPGERFRIDGPVREKQVAPTLRQEPSRLRRRLNGLYSYHLIEHSLLIA